MRQESGVSGPLGGLFWPPGPSAGLAPCWVLGPHVVDTLFHGTVPSGVWLPSLWSFSSGLLDPPGSDGLGSEVGFYL